MDAIFTFLNRTNLKGGKSSLLGLLYGKMKYFLLFISLFLFSTQSSVAQHCGVGDGGTTYSATFIFTGLFENPYIAAAAKVGEYTTLNIYGAEGCGNSIMLFLDNTNTNTGTLRWGTPGPHRFSFGVEGQVQFTYTGSDGSSGGSNNYLSMEANDGVTYYVNVEIYSQPVYIWGIVRKDGVGQNGVPVILEQNVSSDIFDTVWTTIDTVYTDEEGYYGFPTTSNPLKSPLVYGTYRVSVSGSEDEYFPKYYEYDPINNAFKMNQNFNTVSGAEIKEISGKVTRGDEFGPPIQGVNITVIDSATSAIYTIVATDADGNYKVPVEAGKKYILTPALAGYSFTPSTSPTILVDDDKEQDFIGILLDYTISGNISGDITLPATVNLYYFTNPTTPIQTVSTDAAGDYSFFGVLATGDYIVTPAYVAGCSFSPTSYFVPNLLANTPNQDFTATAVPLTHGLIYTEPTIVDFGDILNGKSATINLLIGNSSTTLSINVPNITITGADATNFSHGFSDVITLAPGETVMVAISFTPSSVGAKEAMLNIYHNADGTSPLQVPLSGNSVKTFSTIGPFDVIDFGTVGLNSGQNTREIIITNSTSYPEDFLQLTGGYFENTPSLFTLSGPSGFPSKLVTLGQGASFNVTITLEPTELGLQSNYVHISNTSANMPDARIEIRANIVQGELIVDPSSVDFGVLAQRVPYKDTVVTIQNNSSTVITIMNKKITGDESSFVLLHTDPIILQPNQTDEVTVRFYPPTLGRKNGALNISSDYSFTPELYVPLTGISGYSPSIHAEIQMIDFGTMYKGTTKDTILTISNVGSTDLVISSRSFIGADAEMFTLVTPTTFPFTIRAGASADFMIRATGLLPNGNKSAQLQLNNNDPNDEQYFVNLIANVTSSLFVKSADRIIFDSISIGYYQDTTLVLKNDGDIVCEVSKFELSGPYTLDFSIDATAPFTIAPGETKVVNIRFNPLAVGQRYAVISITVNDAVEPNHTVILQGWGINSESYPVVSIDNNNREDWDFGAVPVRDTRTKELKITNLSKHSKLRIDNMFIDFIESQPFGFGDLEFPIYIQPGETLVLTLTFHPTSAVRSHQANLNIQYSDSVATPNPENIIQVLLKGTVIFPVADVYLTPVLKFDKVALDQTKIAEFDIANRGDMYLEIDSMRIVGADASEFKLLTNFPIILNNENYEVVQIRVSFNPTKIGSKDAKIIIYWNDLFKDEEVELWAEGVQSTDGLVDITKMDEIPTMYNLSQNYPNPFNPTTKIQYSLIESSNVRLSVYNSLGQELAILVDEYQGVGNYSVEFNALNLPSGIYFYRMQSDKFNAVKKMMLLK